MVTAKRGLASALRVFANDLDAVVEQVVGVLTSLAESLESWDVEEASSDDGASSPDPQIADPAPASRRARKATSTSEGVTATAARRAARPRTSAPAPDAVTRETVRTAIAEIGPATAAQVAAHINQSAGRRVVDGRAIRGHAQAAGARVVMRRGERFYRV